MKKRYLSFLAITMMIATSSQAQIPTNGLVAYYPFSGNANDSSGNGNNGTVNGANLSTDRFGKANSAYSFNGLKSMINTNWIGIQGQNDRTISIWFKIVDSVSSGEMLAYGGGFGGGINMMLNSGFRPTIDNSNSYISYNPPITPNVWHNFVLQYSKQFGTTSSACKLYIDGVLLTSISSSYNSNQTLNTTTGNNVHFGPWSVPFYGSLDDIGFWNRILDSTEIQALYHNGGYNLPKNSIPTNGLVAYYPFSGNANDSSGNGNNGIVNGAKLTTDRFGKANSAYSFNGLKSIINTNWVGIQGQNDRTISMWFKIVDSVSSGEMLAYGGGYGGGINMMLTSGFKPTIDNSNSYISYNPSISPNVWHNFVLQYSKQFGTTSTACKLYMDGILLTSSSSSYNSNQTLNTTTGNNVHFGPWSVPFYGSLDDICFWNRVLDSTEIQTLYHVGGYSLPVTIDNFRATQKDNLVSLEWRTATEVNTNNFNIQHSNNGENFIDIGTVKAIGRGANSYNFTDNNPTNDNNYYRLQGVEKDGSSSYSKVVSVNLKDKQSFSIIPNPARDFATINFNKAVDKAIIAVYNMSGKALITKSLSGSTNAFKLNTQSLKSGLYVIKVSTATGNYNEKLLINK